MAARSEHSAGTFSTGNLELERETANQLTVKAGEYKLYFDLCTAAGTDSSNRCCPFQVQSADALRASVAPLEAESLRAND